MMTTTRFENQIPLLLRNLENALRAGYSLKQAFGIVAADLPAPMGAEAAALVAELDSGVPLPQALDDWQKRASSSDLELVLATIRVQFETGGNLADKFSLLSQIISKRSI